MTFPEYASIDMNDFVDIKPTETGWRQIIADVDRLNDNLRKIPQCMHRISVPKADADGYISGQFWSLMKAFDWGECDPGGDMPFSDLRIEAPKTTQETAVREKSNSHQEPDELMRLWKVSTQFLGNSSQIKKADSARWAVEEIRRLRAKANWLIEMHNDKDANGTHIGWHYATDEDLTLEEEI